MATREGISLNPLQQVQSILQPLGQENILQGNVLEVGNLESRTQRRKHHITQIGNVKGCDNGQDRFLKFFKLPPAPQDRYQSEREKVKCAVHDLEIFCQEWKGPSL